MTKALRTGANANKAIGTATGIWIPGYPGKVAGTVGWLVGETGSWFANYIDKKDKGYGVRFTIFKPNFYGYSPTSKFLITAVNTR